MDSVYYNLYVQEKMRVDICKEVVGGLFEELGKWQFYLYYHD